ncbi:uncharacterized protein LOC134443747 [Engraulis encrasicolus]|uniref:uncharacterized protein LOC134443747 n=1 Tax=Engraulis encrasicolus TaxID=184585 RepID=UPI002FD39F62
MDEGVIYSRVGETATLPCDGVGGQNCSSVEWHEGLSYSKLWPDAPPKRAERLSLLPDCSLHITDITTEEAGNYRCYNSLSGQRKEFLLILLDGVIYSSVGGTATLPGDGVGGPNCSSLEWHDYPDVWGFKFTIQRDEWRVSTRKIWPDTSPERAERLSLLPDCSLHITNITTEEAGYYRCYNPLSGRSKEFLFILLDVPSSPSENEVESEDHVTLPCVLHTGFDCDLLTLHPDFNLSWVEVAGTNLWTSTNYQTRKTSACSTTLTVNLTSPAPYSQRRCQVTTGGQVQVSSALHTFGSFLADVYMVVRVAIVLFLTVCAIALEIIWRRRRQNSQ